MRWSAAIPAAVLLYLCLGALLIAQRPGLYDDEGMMAAGTVHMLYSSGEFRLPHADHSWVCKSGRCMPLMAESRYIGAVKDWLCLPLFALFGPRVAILRLVSLLLGAIGIAGFGFFAARQAGRGAGAITAFALALNPSYAAALIFDNGAVAATMAALGLVCAAAAIYAARPTARAAFATGLAAGFGIWARANFLWTLAAGAAAYAIVYRNWRFPARHWVAAGAGGILGGLPFLIYQTKSRGGTLEAMGLFTASQPFGQLLRYRLFLFADTLLADGEHRRLWGGLGAMPAWVLWTCALAAAAACAACMVAGRGRFARFAALAFALLTGYLLATRLEVAEHHMIAMIPPAVLVCVLAGAGLQARYRSAWVVSAAAALLYAGGALYWQAAAVRGLHRTGGVGLWSDAVFELAGYLDRHYPGREIKILDWGFENNVFDLTRGRLRSKDLFWTARTPQQWREEIREGGVFVLGGPEAVESPAFSPEFRRALAGARPAFTRHAIRQRSGALFAEVLEIQPGSVREPPQTGGVYPAESTGWRWTQARFWIQTQPEAGPLRLTLHLFVPEANLQQLGPVTLSARVGGHALAPEILRAAGAYTFSRELNPEWLKEASGRVDFALDKWLAPGPADSRELGIVLQDVSIEAR